MAHVDGEIGDLALDALPRGNFLSYQRCDMPLEEKWLRGTLSSGVKPGLQLTQKLKALGINEEKPLQAALKTMRGLIAPAEMDRLHLLATAAAQDHVREDHFPEAFDVLWGAPTPISLNRRPSASDYFPT